MSEAFLEIEGDPKSGFLVVVDHASNRVPHGVDLGVAPELLVKHIGWDIGAEVLGQSLCGRLGCPGLFGNVSRLVLDLNREQDSPALIPAASDGHPIPGNERRSAEERAARLDRFWRPYHARLANLVRVNQPELVLAIHSFTPRLETSGGIERPWEIGILYNQDDRAARFAIDALRARGLTTGDNEPYSGKLLNATMNMHAEAAGIPYLAIEIRNDLIGNDVGVKCWAHILESVAGDCRNKLAQNLS